MNIQTEQLLDDFRGDLAVRLSGLVDDRIRSETRDLVNIVDRILAEEREKIAEDTRGEIADALADERIRIIEEVSRFLLGCQSTTVTDRGFAYDENNDRYGITLDMVEAIVNDDTAWQKRIRSL